MYTYQDSQGSRYDYDVEGPYGPSLIDQEQGLDTMECSITGEPVLTYITDDGRALKLAGSAVNAKHYGFHL